MFEKIPGTNCNVIRSAVVGVSIVDYSYTANKICGFDDHPQPVEINRYCMKITLAGGGELFSDYVDSLESIEKLRDATITWLNHTATKEPADA